jgi:hypothetical protein
LLPITIVTPSFAERSAEAEHHGADDAVRA